jgi:hypothetical protein
MSKEDFGIVERVFQNSFNEEEALKRQGITLEAVEEFRLKMKSSKILPKAVGPPQVVKIKVKLRNLG